MAVRFTADAQDYNRTVSLGSQANWSMSCWAKVVTDRNTYSTVWFIGASTSDYGYLQTDVDGTTMGYWDAGVDTTHHGARAMTLGSWYWWGVAVNGGAGAVYSRAVTDTSSTVSTWASGGQSAITQTSLIIGESVFTNEWLNGSVMAFKWWSATLTQAEMEQEAQQFVPYRTTNLRAWYPFDRPATADFSGNGQTLSGGASASLDNAVPPIPWMHQRIPVIRGRSTVSEFQGWGIPV